jgi:hypothetical protein
MTVIGDFNVRGGISSRVVARYEGPAREPARRRRPPA